MKSFVLGLLVLYFTGSLTQFPWSPAKKRQNECDDEQVKECFKPLEEFSNPFSGSKLQELRDAENLEQKCSLLASSKSCMDNFNECGISEDTSLTIQTLAGSMSYICSEEGKDALLAESQCLGNSSFEKECSDELEQMLQQAMMQLTDTPEDNVKAICGLIENYSVCTGDQVTGSCTEKDVTFVRSLVIYLTYPFKSMMGCENQFPLLRYLDVAEQE